MIGPTGDDQDRVISAFSCLEDQRFGDLPDLAANRLGGFSHLDGLDGLFVNAEHPACAGRSKVEQKSMTQAL